MIPFVYSSGSQPGYRGTLGCQGCRQLSILWTFIDTADQGCREAKKRLRTTGLWYTKANVVLEPQKKTCVLAWFLFN